LGLAQKTESPLNILNPLLLSISVSKQTDKSIINGRWRFSFDQPSLAILPFAFVPNEWSVDGKRQRFGS